MPYVLCGVYAFPSSTPAVKVSSTSIRPVNRSRPGRTMARRNLRNQVSRRSCSLLAALQHWPSLILRGHPVHRAEPIGQRLAVSRRSRPAVTEVHSHPHLLQRADLAGHQRSRDSAGVGAFRPRGRDRCHGTRVVALFLAPGYGIPPCPPSHCGHLVSEYPPRILSRSCRLAGIARTKRCPGRARASGPSPRPGSCRKRWLRGPEANSC